MTFKMTAEYARVWGEWEAAQQEAGRAESNDKARYWIGKMVEYDEQLAKLRAQMGEPQP